MNFKNKKVTVMGIGLHGGGVSMVEWLSKQGAKVIATDKKNEKDLNPSIEKLKKLKNVTIVTGKHRMEDFTNVDMVIKNPMVPWSNKYIQEAKRSGVDVEMDSSLFFKICPSKKIVGITGTKGKTTTASLVYEMLKNEGRDVVKVGVGQEAVVSKLEKINKKTTVVFELSSWRCSALAQIKQSPKISVVTNIFPDHLNYYDSMEDYIKDKKNIFLFQKEDDVLLLNADDETVDSFSTEAEGDVLPFSLNEKQEDPSVFVREGKIFIRSSSEEEAVISVSKISLSGAHNIYNACAMCGVGLVLSIPLQTMKKTLEEFSGVSHRLETVDKVLGIKFVNDTAATTPESAIAGINSFTENIHLICGGSSKNLALGGFSKKISETKNVKNLYFLQGDSTEKIVQDVKGFGAEKKVCGVYSDMQKAVLSAFQNAKKDEVVLLSPGCASFGMFMNEFDRGNKFKDVVQHIRKKSK